MLKMSCFTENDRSADLMVDNFSTLKQLRLMISWQTIHLTVKSLKN